jgi:outer membrane protein W
MKQMPEIGNGIIGLGVGASYYSWSASGAAGSVSWKASTTYIPIGVTANYHFPLEDSPIDPFLGLGLGYSIVSYSCDYTGITAACGDASSSALYVIGRAGVRYHMEKFALYADAGAGDATLNVGVMFRAP